MNDKCSFLILNEGNNEPYEYYLAILNSSLLWFYIQNTSSEYSGGYFAYTNTYLEPFPLPDLHDVNSSKIIIDKAELMLSTTSEFQGGEHKFTNYLQSQFSIEKVTKKLQNWHELEFGDFIKELNKAIKKVGGEKLTKTDEMDWMDVFETKKAEAQTLKAEIDKTDAEIDAMVYELYGLSKDEIAIVENS